MQKLAWERWASILICLCLGGGVLWLGLRYALPLIFPFVLAWCVSLGVRPMAKRISQRFGISRKICSAVLLTFLLSGAIVILSLCVRRLLQEFQQLLERLISIGESSEMTQIDWFGWLTSKMDFLRRLEMGDRFSIFRDRFNTAVSESLKAALTSLSANLPRAVATFAGAVPSVFLATVVTVIAGFYFCAAEKPFGAGEFNFLPASVQKQIPVWKARMKRISWRYLRAYLLLLLLTFAQLFLGFILFRVEYALLLALLVALVDLLPILGVGTVLVPWAIVALLQHDLYRGIGLLILYLLVTVLRQFLEPRLLGKSLGLSPLLTLFSTWVGWQLFGILGMLIAPFLALAIKLVVGQVRQARVEFCD